MIQDVLYMNGYGLYVWSSFVFTLSCFWILHSVIKLQLIKEQRKFEAKFESLDIVSALIGSVTELKIPS